jgi:hypothetical protein
LAFTRKTLIMKTLQPLLALLLFSVACMAQPQALPYTSGFDNTAQQTDWQEFRKGLLNNYSWDISNAGGSSAPSSVYHDYPVGQAGTDTVIDWWVSPAFIVNNGAKLSFKHIVYSIIGSATPNDEFSIWYSTTTADPATGNYQKIADLTQEVTSNSTTWNDTADIIIPANGNIYIAFKYKATNNWFTISLDDVAVNPAFGVGINETKNVRINIYPNPAKDVVTIKSDVDFSLVHIIDLSGRIVLFKNGIAGSSQLDVSSLASGLYLINIFNRDGELCGTQNLCINR